MDRAALHLEIRNALSVADELSRYEHHLGEDSLAGCLSALRTSLGELERDVGRSHEAPAAPSPLLVEGVERSLQALLIRKGDFPRELHARAASLFASTERVSSALWDPMGRVPSKTLYGVLPVARVLPQDAHSVLDYVHSAAFAATAVFARTGRAKAVGALLGAGLGGASLMTDQRLAAKSVISIERHELLDYAVGIFAIAAPFAFGYAKKDPIAAIVHVGLGVGTIVTSLVTDYRAAKGITAPQRSKGGPRD